MTEQRDWRTQPPPIRRLVKKQGRGVLIFFLIIAAMIPPVCLAIVCGGVMTLLASQVNNAKCPVCGTEFRVPETCPMELDDRHYSCPGCGRVVGGYEVRLVGGRIEHRK